MRNTSDEIFVVQNPEFFTNISTQTTHSLYTDIKLYNLLLLLIGLEIFHLENMNDFFFKFVT